MKVMIIRDGWEPKLHVFDNLVYSPPPSAKFNRKSIRLLHTDRHTGRTLNYTISI